MGAARARLEQNIQHWNAHASAAWIGDFSPAARIVGTGASGSGIDMARMFYSIGQDAFPDNEVRVTDIFEDGATAILQAEFWGTQTEVMNAPEQTIPGTGRRVLRHDQQVRRWEDHTITLYFDRAELLGELGPLPAPAEQAMSTAPAPAPARSFDRPEMSP